MSHKWSDVVNWAHKAAQQNSAAASSISAEATQAPDLMGKEGTPAANVGPIPAAKVV
jgi:hypothetical protein